MEMSKAYYESPIGMIEIVGTDAGIASLNFRDDQDDASENLPKPLEVCLTQLDEYFQHNRQSFDVPLLPEGTNFQMKVWRALADIPFGKIVSYLDIAKHIGDQKAVRAIGNANGKNPISIILPCHRVIGSNGKLIGYGGGIWRKEWLLKHEGGLLI